MELVIVLKRDHRRSRIDGWRSTKTPVASYRRKRKRGRKKLRANVCRLCGGKKAQVVEGFGKVHKSCFVVWRRASGEEVSLRVLVQLLSPRQREVVRLTSLGLRNEEIGRLLGISRLSVLGVKQVVRQELGIAAGLFGRLAIEGGISPRGDRLTAEELGKIRG